ncbi:uncharacterized protein LOC103311487, partial [Acyrthosiphon pisum]|uniref:DDE Tnp4 domain-containing protein n=1 Tax=Acyrthosiphon pisum TaxID=7029 RepID=A0A8R2FCT7_ACYPI
YLSTGTYLAALKFDFQVGRITIGIIVKDTCQALWTVLQPTETPVPTMNDWLEISNVFYVKTNFPNCLGAIDGKHIQCKNPSNSGSFFFNYKKFVSVVLMAIADVGSYGREGDSNIFKECPFGKMFYEKKLNLPEPNPLPNTNNNPQTFVFIGDEAFALHTNLLRPYPGRNLTDTRRVFNYRLSRAIGRQSSVLSEFLQINGVDGINFEEAETHSLDDIDARGTGTRSEGIEVRDYFPTILWAPVP